VLTVMVVATADRPHVHRRRPAARPPRGLRRLAVAALWLSLSSGARGADLELVPTARVAVGGGVDSNVRLTPLTEASGVAGPVQAPRAGAFASVSAALALGVRRGGLSSGVEYGLLQIAYPESTLDDASFQMHSLEWTTELRVGRSVRLRLPVRGDASFIGLARGVEPFEWSGGAEPEAAFYLDRRTRLRLSGGLATHVAADRALSFLDGVRGQVRLGFDGSTPGGWSIALGLRYRTDSAGQAVQRATSSAAACAACAVTFGTSYSYQAPGLTARLAAPYSWALRPSLSASLEDRRYAASSLRAEAADGRLMAVAAPRRRDLRFTAGAALAYALSERWQISVRYDFLDNHSGVEGSGGGLCPTGDLCHPLARTDHSYRKHSAGLELEADWL
jgi:hypothetical protein